MPNIRNILVFLLIPLVLYAEESTFPENVTQKYSSKMPFAAFNIVSAKPSVLGTAVSNVYGHPVFWICPLPEQPEKKSPSCAICFFYGGSQKGIEKKFFAISDILAQKYGAEVTKQLWVIRLKGSDDKYALILDPMNSSKKDVINFTRELAKTIKESSDKNANKRLDKFATPICTDIINSDIRYQPRSLSSLPPENGNLANLLDNLDNARFFLQNQINVQETDQDSVLIATYDRENDQLIPIAFPKDANAFKDKKTNIVIVKESGIGVGTMYYVGYSPETSEAFDSKYSVPAIAFPIKMPGDQSSDNLQHVVNTPFNRDLDTDEMVAYGFKYVKEKVNEAFLEIESLNVPSRFVHGKPVHEVLPKQTHVLVMTLLLIEHMDYANYWPYLLYQKKKHHRILLGIKEKYKKKLDQLMQSQMRKVLVNLAANEENSYHYAMSRSGAYGLAQIIKPTYKSLIKLYPKAQLIPDFYDGMRHHSNAIMAQFLHLDSELFTLSQAKPLQNIIHPDRINQHPFLGFDLMIAGYNFSAPRLMKLINKYGYKSEQWRKRIPWETQLYLLKGNYVKRQIQEISNNGWAVYQKPKEQ